MDLSTIVIRIFSEQLLLPPEFVQLLTAAIVGFFIGLEREKKGKPASMRTFSLICVGSCLFTLLSSQTSGQVDQANYDITRIAAQIVSGVGFLGAGVIFKTHDKIEGVTTAALIWVSAAMGMACGYNQLNLVLWTILVWVGVYLMTIVTHWVIFYKRVWKINLKKKEKERVQSQDQSRELCNTTC